MPARASVRRVEVPSVRRLHVLATDLFVGRLLVLIGRQKVIAQWLKEAFDCRGEENNSCQRRVV